MRSASTRRLVGILCTFNRPAQVRQFLQILEEQTRVPDLVLIVDNGGDPDVRSLVENSDATRVPRVRYVDPGANIGPAGAFRLGLHELGGDVEPDDFVVHFDDDDPPVDPDQLNALCDELGAAITRDASVGGMGLSGGRLHPMTGTIAPVTRNGRIEVVDHLHGGYLPVYRAKALLDIGGNDESFFYGFEELELGRRLRERGHKLLVFNELMDRLEERYPKRSSQVRHAPGIDEGDLGWSRYHKERNLIRVLHRERLWAAIATTVLGRHLIKPLVLAPRNPRVAARRAALGLRATINGLRGQGGADSRYRPPERWSDGDEDHPAWLLPPEPPSMTAYRQLRRTTGSLMRELMNIEIQRVGLVGRVVDIGGGRNASYAALLSGSKDVVSVNIDREIEPSVIADLGRPLPFSDDTFDTVVSFNTLEHLADDQFALQEMIRVLRPGGTAHILVPFLYRVHGHPHDFHRHTARGWNLMLRQAGVPDRHQRIRPLVWDPLATAWAIADLAPLGRNWWRARRFLRPLILRRPLITGGIDKRLPSGSLDLMGEYALAYAVEAQKPIQ